MRGTSASVPAAASSDAAAAVCQACETSPLDSTAVAKASVKGTSASTIVLSPTLALPKLMTESTKA